MKLNSQTILTLAKKEFISFFNSATAYILIVPFLLITSILYLRTSFLFGQASLTPYFEILPYFLLLLAPAIAMRTFAQHQKSNTLEVFFSHPITEMEIILSKFLGALGFYIVVLATTFVLPISTLLFAKPDIFIIISQYFGAILVGATFISISIACASLTNSQVSSFLLSAFTAFVLVIIGFDFILMSLPPLLSAIVSQIAIMPHASNISKGYIDLRDLLYFLTAIAAFLTIAITKLSARKLIENPAEKRKLNLALGLILAIGFVFNVLMYSYPIRLDITRNQIFSLSAGTKQTLSSLPDIVTINYYTTSSIPGSYQSAIQKINDTLKDYQSLSKGKVKVIYRKPDLSTDDQTQAAKDGIQQVQFNQYGSNSMAVAAGYFGASIYYGDQKEVIPFFESIEDIEYQLTSKIRNLTLEEKPILSVYAQSGSLYDQSKSIASLSETLSTQFEIQSVALEEADTIIPSKNLLVHGITAPFSATAAASIESYLGKGGNAVLFLDSSSVEAQTGSATPFPTGLENLLSQFGVKYNQNLVYDLAQNEIIRLSDQNQVYFLAYPYWNRAVPADKNFPGLSALQYVSMGWSNSLTLDPKEGITLTPLLKTSKQAGIQENTYYTTPEAVAKKTGLLEDNLTEHILAVAIKKGEQKIIVVGDGDFATDQFTGGNPNNLDFAISAIEWTSTDNVLGSIKKKTGDNPVFTFSSPSEAMLVQWADILLSPALVLGFAVWYLLRRKKLSQRSFQ